MSLFTKENLQTFFDTDFDELLEQNHEDIEYIEQSHYGNLLIEKFEGGGERCQLWANYDGEEITGIEVEYCGCINSYKWETVFEIYK